MTEFLRKSARTVFSSINLTKFPQKLHFHEKIILQSFLSHGMCKGFQQSFLSHGRKSFATSFNFCSVLFSKPIQKYYCQYFYYIENLEQFLQPQGENPQPKSIATLTNLPREKIHSQNLQPLPREKSIAKIYCHMVGHVAMEFGYQKRHFDVIFTQN